MIPVPRGVRAWLAAGVSDMRRGMNGLALQVQQALERDPLAIRPARPTVLSIIQILQGLAPMRQATHGAATVTGPYVTFSSDRGLFASASPSKSGMHDEVHVRTEGEAT